MAERLKAIPTTYNGIKFRSKLEAKYAHAFDRLGIVWIYEGEGFRFKDGTQYCPDFYMPEINTYFEVKGVMDEASLHKIESLAQEADRVIVGGPQGNMLASIRDKDWYEPFCGGYGFIAECSQCKKKWFGHISGSYRCPHCGAWDGDHYMASYEENVFDAAGWSHE